MYVSSSEQAECEELRQHHQEGEGLQCLPELHAEGRLTFCCMTKIGEQVRK